MSKKLKLTKITLQTADGKTVELSIQEAKELYEQLDDLFGEKTAPLAPLTPIYIERPWRPRGPCWTDPIWYGNTKITCRSDTGMSMSLQGETVGG